MLCSSQKGESLHNTFQQVLCHCFWLQKHLSRGLHSLWCPHQFSFCCWILNAFTWEWTGTLLYTHLYSLLVDRSLERSPCWEKHPWAFPFAYQGNIKDVIQLSDLYSLSMTQGYKICRTQLMHCPSAHGVSFHLCKGPTPQPEDRWRQLEIHWGKDCKITDGAVWGRPFLLPSTSLGAVLFLSVALPFILQKALSDRHFLILDTSLSRASQNCITPECG